MGLKGALSKGTRHQIGAAEEGRPIIIVEGWATGWSCYLAMVAAGRPVTVVVAFSRAGLDPVGRHLRQKRPDAEIIIAADNDRASKHLDGYNPGVSDARRAAAAIGGPGSQSPHSDDIPITQGVDFDDLRQLHGLEDTFRWLNPDMASEAVTDPPRAEEPDEGTGDGDTITVQTLGRGIGRGTGALRYPDPAQCAGD